MERCLDGEKIYVAINADGAEFCANFAIDTAQMKDLITGDIVKTEGFVTLPPYSVQYLKKV